MPARVPDVGPIAHKVVRQLRRQVIVGQLTVGMELPSVRRLAELSGIGVVTANRVLQRVEREGWAERYVGRRLRVAKGAMQLAETHLRRDLPPVVAWVTSYTSRAGLEGEFSGLSEGFAQVFPGCSIRQVFVDPQNGLDSLRQLLDQDARMSCEIGYVLSGMPSIVKRLFASASLPCVVAGHVEPDIRLSCVYEDMTEVGRIAGQVLCPRGRVIALSGPELVGAEIYLVDGFTLVARSLGQSAPRPHEFYRPLSANLDEAREQIEQLLTSASRPASILAIRPEHATLTVQVAARRGIRIPEEVQLVGLHHHPMYKFVHPVITSIGPPSLIELGERCARLLAEAMAQPPGAARREVIESTLIEGSSTLSSRHEMSTSVQGKRQT